MTLVGPRPALYNQYELIEKRKKLGIDKIKPGITGLAQISGRDLIELDTKIFYDLEYLKKKNFLFDIKIILKTIFVVIKKKGILH
jgi:O-antigen biosynthesis protein WbqP